MPLSSFFQLAPTSRRTRPQDLSFHSPVFSLSYGGKFPVVVLPILAGCKRKTGGSSSAGGRPLKMERKRTLVRRIALNRHIEVKDMFVDKELRVDVTLEKFVINFFVFGLLMIFQRARNRTEIRTSIWPPTTQDPTKHICYPYPIKIGLKNKKECVQIQPPNLGLF